MDLSLEGALAAWVNVSVGEAASDQTVDRMRALAVKLGWIPMLNRLRDAQPTTLPQDSGDSAALIDIARATLNGKMPYEAAKATASRMAKGDFYRALLCLFAHSNESLAREGVNVGVLRLAAETATDNEFSARAFLALGRVMAASPDWAMHAFDYGLKRLGDAKMPALQATLYLDLSRCFSQLGKLDEASVAAGAASVLAKRAGDPTTADTASVLSAVSLLKAGQSEKAAAALVPLVAEQLTAGIRSGAPDASVILAQCIEQKVNGLLQSFEAADVADAVAQFEGALALASPSGFAYPRELEGRAVLAQLLAARGRYDEAVEQARRLVEGLDTAESPGPFLQVICALGARLLASGRDAAAMALLGGAIAKRRDGWPSAESTRLRMLHGAAQQKSGAYQEAEGLLRAVRDESVAAGLLPAAAVAAYVLGENAIQQRKFEQALSWYGEAERLAAQENDVHLLGAALNKIGTTWGLLRRPAEAVAFHERALEIHRQGSESGAAVVVDLIQAAQAYLDTGNLARARALAEELEVLGPRYPPDDREWIPFVIARVAAAEGNWERACAHFRAALAIIEDQRARIESPEAQRQWSAQKADTYGLAIEAAIAAGAAEDAIEFLELGRHRYLQALVNQRAAPKQRAWRDLARAVPPGHAAVWFGAFPRGLGVVAARRCQDGSAIVDSRFDRTLNGADMTALFEGDLRPIRDAYAQGRLVDYLAEVMAGKGRIDFGADARWQDRGEEWEAGFARACDVLQQRVWPVILSAVGDEAADLLLLPSVGCSELPTTAAAPDATASGAPISLCVAPSLSMLAERLEEWTRPAAGERSFAQIINPTEDPRLPCCLIEARLAAEASGGEVHRLPGRRAKRERVLEALGSYDVVHFLGHAFVDWRDSLDSGLLCAALADQAGLLTVRDILRNLGRIRSRVIILSACEIGNVQAGDRQNEFVNLPTALVAAGAGTVVAPRWRVDDVPTALLLSKTLSAWWGGIPMTHALATARRWLRDDATRDIVSSWLDAALVDPTVDRDALMRLQHGYRDRFAAEDRPFAHPRHWGAFEVVGIPTA